MGAVARGAPGGNRGRTPESGAGPVALMAIYHFSAKIVSRAQGQSVVASAAYRSGELLRDEHIGQDFDYTRKEGIEHSEILAAAQAPEWVFDRQALWNAVEACEKRKDAQLARE